MAKSPPKRIKPTAKDAQRQREDEILSDEEISKRRDEGLRRLLKTPPETHAEVIGKGKPRRKGKKNGQ